MSGSGGITYLDGRRFSRSLLAAADWVDGRRDELNRINVFPVPDGDTGTNFALTLRAGAEAVRSMAAEPLGEVASAAADGCVFSARGNSGLLFSQFMLGFRDAIGSTDALDTPGLARAVKGGADQLGAALDSPVEGTILTVCRDVATAAASTAVQTGRHDILLRGMLESAWASLRRTPQLLTALREAGVVDAGAKAFVLTLEGVLRLVDGHAVERPPMPEDGPSFAAARAVVAADRDFEYCTEVLVRSRQLPAAATVRAALRPLGGSIVVINTGTALKVHVHTDTPERVFELAERWGKLEKKKADNMRAQHQALAAVTRNATIVADSSCDLFDDSLDKHGIELVPCQVISGRKIYVDRVDLQPGEIYELARNSPTPLTTSQPAPGAWARAFQEGRAAGGPIICLTLSSVLSGTYASAQTAARAVGGGDITVFDSRTTSLGLGLLGIKAAELTAAGQAPPEVTQELHRIRDQSSGFFSVDTFDQLLRSGRVSRARAWLGSLLNVKPLFEIVGSGHIVPIAKVRGREAVIRRVFQVLEQRLTPRPRRLRFGVVHANVPEVAARIRDEIQRRFHPTEILVSPVTTAIGVHTGPGAWGVFYQNEDPPVGNQSRSNSLL